LIWVYIRGVINHAHCIAKTKNGYGETTELKRFIQVLSYFALGLIAKRIERKPPQGTRLASLKASDATRMAKS
jgi:hypothetical protein